VKLIVIGYKRRCAWLVIQSRATAFRRLSPSSTNNGVAHLGSARYNLCPHISAKKTVAAFHGTLKDVFEENHPPLDCENFSQNAENEAFGELSLDITIVTIRKCTTPFTMKTAHITLYSCPAVNEAEHHSHGPCQSFALAIIYAFKNASINSSCHH